MNEYMLANKSVDINLEKEKFKEKDEKLMEIKRKNLPIKAKSKTLEEQRKMANVFGSLSAVLFLVCFIMGAGLIQSDDRISELEAKLTKLDQSYKYILTQVKEDNVQSVFAESNEYNSNISDNLNNSGNQSYNTKETLSKATSEITTENITEITTEITTIHTTLSTPTTIENDSSKKDIESNYKTYEVKDGDSLEAISKRFYGNRNKINDIMEVNGIDDPHKIYSGMTIKLP
ncbi:MAG: LysM peptidoglycan-binding domain-containing protein [Eubacteriales bacterium]|nr:LysM peptidoglycan-binding domain-containing protein [Eubacteriales bacterium]